MALTYVVTYYVIELREDPIKASRKWPRHLPMLVFTVVTTGQYCWLRLLLTTSQLSYDLRFTERSDVTSISEQILDKPLGVTKRSEPSSEFLGVSP